MAIPNKYAPFSISLIPDIELKKKMIITAIVTDNIGGKLFILLTLRIRYAKRMIAIIKSAVVMYFVLGNETIESKTAKAQLI